MAAAKPPPLMAPAPQHPAINHNIHALSQRTYSNGFASGPSPSAAISPASASASAFASNQQQQPLTTARATAATGQQSGGYFHHQNNDTADPTAANTIANSQLASPAAAEPGISHLETQQQQQAQQPSSLRPTKFTEEWDASVRGSSIIDGGNSHNMQRSNSFSGSAAGDGESIKLPSRGNTLKKKASLRRSGSRSGALSRSGSRRSMKAGSVRSLALQSSSDPDESHSAFYCPVPTQGNPTDVLASRFTSWRKILKDLITYFREIQTHYDHRAKSLVKLANVLNNTSAPAGMLSSGGLDDALQILRVYNRQAIAEAQKAREIEEDVILSLTGLRSDLQTKIKEIKALASDFKNQVDREMDATRKAVKSLQDVIGQSEMDASLTTGKQDPYILRLAVDRQLARQLEEENYLHQAYLNLENSGRELESIVVGEIQKSYKAYAGILTRESDNIGNAVEDLRTGPIAMPKDHEWMSFVKRDDQFVDPDLPVRQMELIHYPGRDHHAAQEIRAGLLERKSKYLKSYTAGWYVLSPTHLHEFKSADKTQAPIMSLYLPEQKLGSHSTDGSSSNKFILKGRQTGSMHRGHTWVFRAESHDTMMAWYEDIKALTDSSPAERHEFVRGHSRSFSRSSQRSVSSDGAIDQHDEADDVPFDPDAEAASTSAAAVSAEAVRPSPGGRFPSDLQVNAQRGLQAPNMSPDSVGSEVNNKDTVPDPMLQQQQAYYAQVNPANPNPNPNPGMSDPALIAAAAGLPGSQIGRHPDGQYGAGGMVVEGQAPGPYAGGRPVSASYGQYPNPNYQNYAPAGMQTLSNYIEQTPAPTPGASAPQPIQGTGSAAPVAVNGWAGMSPPPPQQQQPYTTQEAFGMRDSMAGQPAGYGYYAAAGAAGGAAGAGLAHHHHQQAHPQQLQPQQPQPEIAEFSNPSPMGPAAVRVNSSSTFGHSQEAYQSMPAPVPVPIPVGGGQGVPAAESLEKNMNGVPVPLMTGASGPASTMSMTTEASTAASTPTRPTAGGRNNSEAPTISNLHIPGEYPKATPQL